MKRFPFFFLWIVFSYALVGSLPLSASSDSRMVKDFSENPVGKFPSDFRTYPFQRGKAATVYSVRMEGDNLFLKATVAGATQGTAVQVFKRFDWDLTQWPKLSWRWRADSLPSPPAGSREHFDDNACGVYVVFGGYGGKAIKYIWSTDLPAGTVKEDTPGKFFVVVAASGAKERGEWQTVAVNVVDEYRRLFKVAPSRNPSGIGLLTDGDGTHSPAICDYDDFRLSK